MNKIFNRQLFRTSARRPTAHGSGITQLVMDGKPVQGFADGSDQEGVSPAYLDEANMERTRTDISPMGGDVPLAEYGFPINSDLRVNGGGAPPVQPSSYNEEPVQYAQANTGTASDGSSISPTSLNASVPTVIPARPAARTQKDIMDQDAQLRAAIQSGGIANVPNVEEMAKKYGEMYQKMYPGKSAEQYLEERKRLMGDDKDSYQLQALLKLMEFGGTMATTPGNLATAFGAAVQKTAPGLQKMAAERAQNQRELKLSAIAAAERDEQTKAQLGVKGLETAVSQTFQERQAAVQQAFTEKLATINRIASAQERETTFEQQNFLESRREAQSSEEKRKEFLRTQSAKDPVTFAIIDNGSKNGFRLAQFKQNTEGNYVNDSGPLPANSFRFTPEVANYLMPKFSAPKEAYAPDGTSPTLYKNIHVQDDDRGTPMMLNNDGSRSPLPAGTIFRGQTEMFKHETKNGEFITTIQDGPRAGLQIRRDDSGRILNAADLEAQGIDTSKIRSTPFAPVSSSVVPVAPLPPANGASPSGAAATPPSGAAATPAPAPPTRLFGGLSQEESAQTLEAIKAAKQNRANSNRGNPVFAITGDNIQGTLVKAAGASGVDPRKLSESELAKIRSEILEIEKAMRVVEQATESAYKGTGISSNVEAILSNILNPVAPSLFPNFQANEIDRQKLKILGQTATKGISDLDDQARRSDFQQKEYLKLVPNPEKWLANPKNALEQLREVHLTMANRLEENRALLERRQPLRLMRVPTGTPQDPFTPEYLPYIDAMRADGKIDLLKGKRIALPGMDPRNYGYIK